MSAPSSQPIITAVLAFSIRPALALAAGQSDRSPCADCRSDYVARYRTSRHTLYRWNPVPEVPLQVISYENTPYLRALAAPYYKPGGQHHSHRPRVDPLDRAFDHIPIRSGPLFCKANSEVTDRARLKRATAVATPIAKCLVAKQYAVGLEAN